MTPWIDQLLRDFRFGTRSLAKSPGFTALAVLSLALGIMATTAIYSVLHAVVLDPFPYKDVDHLTSVRVSNAALRGGRTGYSIDQFLEIAERSTIFDGVIASTVSDVIWTGQGDPQRLRGNYGTFNTFVVMGVRPLVGRTPNADDAKPGATRVVVLGYRFWQRQFAGDRQVLGRQLKLNDNVRTVIGVMPKRFMWRGADVYLPTHFERGRAIEGVRSVHLLGRLKPGVTEPRAEADLRPIIQDLKTREPGQFPEKWTVGLLPFTETFPSGIRSDVWVLFGAVALLLLISCANVSNLLLSRATARQREMSVRAALGASRPKLARQLLTETSLLAVVAGGIGTALAYAGLPAILAIVPPDTIPDESEVAINGSVLAFTLVVSSIVAMICGLAPALYGSRRDLATSMREASRSLAGNARHALLRNGLVVIEVMLSIMLLAGSSLLVRSYRAIAQTDLGVRADRVLAMRVPLPAQRYPDAPRRVAFFQDVLRRVEAVPGVQAVGVNTGLHPLGNMWTVADIPGAPASSDPVVVHQISSGYTGVMGLRLASGRWLTEGDVDAAQHVALVNERFVQTRLAGLAPIGRVMRLPRLKQAPFGISDDAFQIVGIVKDALNQGLSDPVLPEVLLPFTPLGIADWLVLSTDAAEPAGLTHAVTAEIHAVDANQPVTSVRPLIDLINEDELATPRFNLTLISLFAALGLMLAVVGVYGVMSTVVSQQRHEIGVRLALGASRRAIAQMVVTRGAWLLGLGIVAGLGGSALAARLLARQVWNVAPFDPVAFGAVSLILLATGLLACAWPARRAARVDPIVALRDDA